MREPTFYKQQKVNENKRSTEEEEDRGKKKGLVHSLPLDEHMKNAWRRKDRYANSFDAAAVSCTNLLATSTHTRATPSIVIKPVHQISIGRLLDFHFHRVSLHRCHGVGKGVSLS